MAVHFEPVPPASPFDQFAHLWTWWPVLLAWVDSLSAGQTVFACVLLVLAIWTIVLRPAWPVLKRKAE